MSDGNFNRSLLPHNSFRDGMNAGKAQTRMKAMEAFSQFLQQHHNEWTDAERESAKEDFRQHLN